MLHRVVQLTLRPGTLSAERASPTVFSNRKAGWLSVGGILAALGTGACCVAPFALLMLGISGAWITNLTALKPYQPIFAAVSFAFLGYGFYLVYRRSKFACAEDSYCAKSSSGRIAKIGLWTATVLVVIGLGFPKIASFFLT